MAIIHRSKKRKIIIGAILSTVVVAGGITVFVLGSKKKKADELEMPSGIVETEKETEQEHKVTDDMVADDERYQHFDCVDMFEGIYAGDLIDIRINFPNGEDYIVVSRKEIKNIDEKGIVLKVNEEEILKMSSAKIDMNKYQGTRIYAVKYINKNQKSAISYYLLNEYVLTLCEWNPNLVDKIFSQDKIKKRYDFEQNLVKFQIEKEVG
ncbi:MAG: hypothetical protein E7270_03155 [Lachnospiraceae bacterium]|nr:hypothetical protein [Lachnospiraceae bacterium]MBQ4069381.1 hypothetical protein [Lachnospiraceae bacterium]